jgi:hypothetical protein
VIPPVVPNLAGLPGEAAKLPGKLDDVLAKDEKVKLSTILARNGWGKPNSSLNRQARAIVKRESGGDPSAKNPSGATGLFQMMTPLHCGDYGIPAGGNCQKWLEDPDNNARAAKALYDEAGWRPWAASGGAPLPTNWDTVIVTGKDSVTGSVAAVASDVASPFTAVGSAAVDLIGTLLSADTWFRIGKGGLGFVLIVVGTGAFVYVVANTATGGAVKRAAKTAAKAKGMT